MSRDEAVNGPKIAAAILSRMSPTHQAKLMDAIKAKDIKIAREIDKNITTYEDIATLNDQGAQILVKSIEHKDLVLSLKTAGDSVKQMLFKNMSQRKRQVVEEDFAALPPTKLVEIEEAQRRIVAMMDSLITHGLIRTI